MPPIPTITEGWLCNARHVPSPNVNERPVNTEISLLVVHNISLPPEQFGGDSSGNSYIEQFFTNSLDHDAHPYFDTLRGVEVSAHLLITREGEVVQFVDFAKRAWHAGRSSFQGQVECNDYSIGIELEGADTIPYTEAQYTALAQVTQSIMQHYPAITTERITGHSDIAPGRKTDPGEAFDWGYFQKAVKELSA